MKKKILIDVTRSPNTGIGRYSWDLLYFLSKSNNEYEFIGLTFPENSAFANSKSLNTILTEHNPTNDSEIKELSKLIDNSADIYVATNFSQIVFPRIPIIQVVHDLIYSLNPQWQPTENDLRIRHGSSLFNYAINDYLPKLQSVLSSKRGKWKNLSISSPVSKLYVFTQSHSILRANSIIVISNETRNNLLEYYEISRSPHVIYPLMKEYYQIEKLNRNAKKHDKIILLYIANFEPRKNHQLLFQALSILPSHLKTKMELVLIGKKFYESHYDNFIKSFAAYKNEINIEIFTDISEREKQQWLQKSSFLVYPSLNEGFGLPLLEAMIFNLPIILLHTPISNEVCGNGAIYVYENSHRAFAEAIEYACYYNNKVRNRIIEQQKKQIEKFNYSLVNKKFNSMIKNILEVDKENYTYHSFQTLLK